MVSLIKKEFKIYKSWIFLLILSIVFAFFISMSIASVETTGIEFIQNIAFSYTVFMLVYIGVIDNNYQDIKNKSDVVLNSFPINRKTIVRSKYAIMILYIIMYFIPMWFTIKIFMPLIYGVESQLGTLWSLLIVTTIGLIFFSIYYPLYFKSEDGLMSFNQIFRLIIIFSPSIIARYAGKLPMDKALYFMEKIGNKKTGILILALSFFIYYISLQISKRIYMRKEF